MKVNIRHINKLDFSNPEKIKINNKIIIRPQSNMYVHHPKSKFCKKTVTINAIGGNIFDIKETPHYTWHTGQILCNLSNIKYEILQV